MLAADAPTSPILVNALWPQDAAEPVLANLRLLARQLLLQVNQGLLRDDN